MLALVSVATLGQACDCAVSTGANPAVRRSGVPPDYTHNTQGIPLAGPVSDPTWPYPNFVSDVHLNEIGFLRTSFPALYPVGGDFTNYRLASNATLPQVLKADASGYIEAGDVLSFDVYFESSSSDHQFPSRPNVDAQIMPGAHLDLWLDCATSACDGYSGPGGSSIFEPLFFVPNDRADYNFSSVNATFGARRPAPPHPRALLRRRRRAAQGTRATLTWRSATRRARRASCTRTCASASRRRGCSAPAAGSAAAPTFLPAAATSSARSSPCARSAP